MNRYILVDLKDYCISNLNKVDVDFEINEEYTGSVSCVDKNDLISELLQMIADYMKNEGRDE